MRRTTALVLASLALLAGCGSGSDDDKGGTAENDGQQGSGKPGGTAEAQAFIACFKARGYRAVKPASGQESLFALEAGRKGFPNTPVNVTTGNEVIAAVYLIFFENGDKARQALDELGRSTVGDIPPQQRGAAVLAYTGEEHKAGTEAAINRCL